MQELVLKLQYSKEDLRKYHFFTIFKKSKLYLVTFSISIIIGIISIITYISLSRNSLLIIFGIFLILFPAYIILVLMIQSDRLFKSAKIYWEEHIVTFYEDHIFVTTSDSTQKIYWDKIYEVVWTKKELVIYLGRNLGVYLIRSKYDPEILFKVEELLKKSIPLNKFKLK